VTLFSADAARATTYYQSFGFSKTFRVPEEDSGRVDEHVAQHVAVGMRVEAALEGNIAETTTMLAAIRSFMAAHQLHDMTVVADAGVVFGPCIPNLSQVGY
jgi:uncharacterized glyoxalase superfamily protein PhnB